MLESVQILTYWFNSINMNEGQDSEYSIGDNVALDGLSFPSLMLWGNKEKLQICEISPTEVNQLKMVPSIKSKKTGIIESFQRKLKFTNLLFDFYFISIGRISAYKGIIEPQSYNVVKKTPCTLTSFTSYIT